MARAPSPFDLAVDAFIAREPYRNLEPRGYSTDGTRLHLNRHLIAHWWDHAVRMHLNDPQWHPFLVAQAIEKIRARCTTAGVLAERGEVICKEHEDCRAEPVLGEACARATRRPEKLPKLPHFEEQTRLRKLREELEASDAVAIFQAETRARTSRRNAPRRLSARAG